MSKNIQIIAYDAYKYLNRILSLRVLEELVIYIKSDSYMIMILQSL